MVTVRPDILLLLNIPQIDGVVIRGGKELALVDAVPAEAVALGLLPDHVYLQTARLQIKDRNLAIASLGGGNSEVLWHVPDSVDFSWDWDGHLDADFPDVLSVPDVVQESEVDFLIHGLRQGHFAAMQIVLLSILRVRADQQSVDLVVVLVAKC